MKINRNAERPAPVYHRRVVMRVRDSDGGEAADALDKVDHHVADQADAVPQHIALPGWHQERALVDPERRRHADPDQAGFVPERRHVASFKAFQSGPGLPAWWHVLPFLIANRTGVRRRRR